MRVLVSVTRGLEVTAAMSSFLTKCRAIKLAVVAGTMQSASTIITRPSGVDVMASFSALDFPSLTGFEIRVTAGRWARTTSAVPSVEPSSTTTTCSVGHWMEHTDANVVSMWACSLWAGMMTVRTGQRVWAVSTS